jgi:hypothetical protein
MPKAGDSGITALATTRVNEIAKSYALSKDDAFLVWAANLI